MAQIILECINSKRGLVPPGKPEEPLEGVKGHRPEEGGGRNYLPESRNKRERGKKASAGGGRRKKLPPGKPEEAREGVKGHRL